LHPASSRGAKVTEETKRPTVALTRRRLTAMVAALEGNTLGVPRTDLDAALAWCHQKMRKMGMTDADTT
jgi:hypothetical protein